MLKRFGRMVLPDFTFVRCLVLAFGLAPVTGCYTYAPLTSEPVPGMNVRLTSMGTPQQLTLVSPGDPVRVGGLREVNGSVVANEGGELRLKVDALAFGRFDAPFVVSKRQLSAGRTALLFGGFALGAMTVSVLSATHKDFGNCC